LMIAGCGSFLVQEKMTLMLKHEHLKLSQLWVDIP